MNETMKAHVKSLQFAKDKTTERIGKCETCEVAAKLAQHRWIPVSERLPEDGQYILLANNYKVIGTNWYENTLRRFDGYTYWMPIILPEQALKQKEK